jgi:hypothetical protein
MISKMGFALVFLSLVAFAREGLYWAFGDVRVVEIARTRDLHGPGTGLTRGWLVQYRVGDHVAQAQYPYPPTEGTGALLFVSPREIDSVPVTVPYAIFQFLVLGFGLSLVLGKRAIDRQGRGAGAERRFVFVLAATALVFVAFFASVAVVG